MTYLQVWPCELQQVLHSGMGALHEVREHAPHQGHSSGGRVLPVQQQRVSICNADVPAGAPVLGCKGQGLLQTGLP